MNPKQQATLTRYILHKTDLADLQTIEALCAARRKVILRVVARAGRDGTVSVRIGPGMGKVLR